MITTGIQREGLTARQNEIIDNAVVNVNGKLSVEHETYCILMDLDSEKWKKENVCEKSILAQIPYLQEKASKCLLLGELGHPESYASNSRNVICRIDDVFYYDRKIYGTVILINIVIYSIHVLSISIRTSISSKYHHVYEN